MLNSINTEDELKEAILKLEKAQAEEGKLLKQEFQVAYESIKPINLIKSTIEVVTQSKLIKDKAVSVGLGLAAGFASKLLFEGLSPKPMRKFLGSAIMFGVTSIISKNRDKVKTATEGVFNFVKEKLQTVTKEDTVTEG